MLDTICTLPLSSELFAQAIHPREPALAVGLASGHVQLFKLPTTGTDDGSSEESNSSKPGCATIDTQWRTRRHKISCRALAFSLDGDTLYSAGADGIVKAASSETGQVSSKIAIPPPENNSNSATDAASLLHMLSPQTLLLASDSSALHIYDMRAASHTFTHTKPALTFFPHEDYVTALTPLPASAASTSGFAKQWASTGGTTLAVTDVRKGVLARSAEQDAELTSCLLVRGLPRRGTSVGEKVVVGDGGGVLALFERGVWDDLDERIVLDRGIEGSAAEGESVECLALVPRDVCGSGAMLAAGLGGGLVACVLLGLNRVVHLFRHDEVEPVSALGFDVENRMISGGGQVVKVWQESMDWPRGREDDAEVAEGAKDESPDSDDGDEDAEDDSSSEDERQSRKKRRRKVSATNGRGQLGSFADLD